jgi:hypothetical protein
MDSDALKALVLQQHALVINSKPRLLNSGVADAA